MTAQAVYRSYNFDSLLCELIPLRRSALNTGPSVRKWPTVAKNLSIKPRSLGRPVKHANASAAVVLIFISICCVETNRVNSQETPVQQDSISDAQKLAASLGDADLNKRRDAAYKLATMGKDALPALDALIAQLDDRDEQVWMQSVTAIGKIGTGAEKAIEPLCNTFADRSVQKRYRAAWAIGQIGANALPILG